MQIVMMILLVVLPYGTAIICGALTEWAGKTVSGWSSIGGLALGIYFFSKSMDLLGDIPLLRVHYWSFTPAGETMKARVGFWLLVIVAIAVWVVALYVVFDHSPPLHVPPLGK
jgi:hypothetical protein